MAAPGSNIDVPGPRGRPVKTRNRTFVARRSERAGTLVHDARGWQLDFMPFAIFAAAAILWLLYFGEFTRTARVGGWLVPVGGVAHVFAPHPGAVAAVHVKEGTSVKKGDALVAISETGGTVFGATHAEIARQLDARLRLLVGQREQKAQLAAQRGQAVADRLATLRFEQDQLEREIALQKSRIELATRIELRHRELRVEGSISEQQFRQAHEARLEQAARFATLVHSRSTMARERLALEAELKELPLRTRTELSELDREVAALEDEMAQTEAQREMVVTAPADGIVTSLQTELGGQADTTRPLLSIVPADARLEAQLFSPNAVGSVTPGQRVSLRYTAYPHQPSGRYDGVVESVSASALAPADLPASPGVANAWGPPAAGEPVYRITVKLLRQTLTAYGRQVPLQADMQIEAEIELETRRLYEWLLDSVYAITGWGPQR